MATTSTGAAVLFIPTAIPWMMMVAAPVSAASAIDWVGLLV